MGNKIGTASGFSEIPEEEEYFSDNVSDSEEEEKEYGRNPEEATDQIPRYLVGLLDEEEYRWNPEEAAEMAEMIFGFKSLNLNM